jgi:hypothetical protein
MFRARRYVLVTPAIALLAIHGAGCGGGGSDRVSAAELVQKADQICRQERGSFTRIQSKPPPNASVAADQTAELIKVTRDASSQLRDLKPPEELRSAYDRYLDARDRAVDQMERGRDAAEDRNPATYGAAQAAVASDAPERRKLAQAVGLMVCSSSGASA